MTLSQDIARITLWLDSVGFDLGDHRVSLYRGLLIVVAVVAVLVLGRIASLLMKRLFRNLTHLDAAQQLLGEKISTLIIWTLLVLIAIDFLGISLTALTVFSGAFGLAIGFGLQKTFGNLISGIILLTDRSIKPGDTIAVGSGADKTVGKVDRIGIRAVAVTTRDGIRFLIPNELLMTSAVENWSSATREHKLRIGVGIAHGSDLERAETLILEAAAAVTRVQADPEPKVMLLAFADHAIQLELHLWIEDPDSGAEGVRSDVLRGIWERFRDAGIELPSQPREVFVAKNPMGRTKKLT